MSNHYETLPPSSPYRELFGLAPPNEPVARHLWPRSGGHFIRSLPSEVPLPGASERLAAEPPPAPSSSTVSDALPGVTPPDAIPPEATSNSVAQPARELVAAQWGLVPDWVKSASDGRLRSAKLVNAKSETVSTTRAFHDAWQKGQRCIVPMAAFFEDDWRSGKAVPTRIFRIDGQPMGVAGLWARWTGPDGETLLSYTLLTMNANNHALLRRYQQPGSEKRMPVVLNEGAYGAWLTARMEKAKEFMRQYPAEWLAANPVESKAAGGF